MAVHVSMMRFDRVVLWRASFATRSSFCTLWLVDVAPFAALIFAEGRVDFGFASSFGAR